MAQQHAPAPPAAAPAPALAFLGRGFLHGCTSLALLLGGVLAQLSPGGLVVHFYVDPPGRPLSGTSARPGLVRYAFDSEFRTQKGEARTPSLTPLTADATRWIGLLEIPRPGLYQLRLETPGSALLVLDSAPVASLWSPHTLGSCQRRLFLTAGLHPFRVDYVPAPGASNLKIEWILPDQTTLAPIPAARFFHLPAEPPAPFPSPGSRLLATERTTRLDYAHADALARPYITRWRTKEFGHPTELAPLLARWEGQLDVPGPINLILEGTGAAVLKVGGHTLTKSAQTTRSTLSIPAGGIFPLQLDAFDPGVLRRLTLRWQRSSEEPIPPTHLLPPLAWPASRVPLAVVALAVLLLAAGGPHLYLRFLKRHATTHLWLLLVTAGTLLRLHDYAALPPAGETDDEFAHHTIGASLMAGTTPFGWDFREDYAFALYVPVHGRAFNMVAPLVEWPPLTSFLTGVFSRIAGASGPFDLPLETTRLFPIAVGTLTLLLLFPVGRSLGLSPAACLWATALGAVYPIAVVSNRLIKEDNFLALLYLLSIWLIASGRIHRSFERRWCMGFLIVTSLLTKQLGLATALVFGLVAVYRGQWRLAVEASLFGILGLALFVWYGTSWGGWWFIQLQQKMVGYSGQVNALWPLIGTSRITEVEVGSGWIVGLWLSFALFACSRHRSRHLLVTAVLCYLVILLVACPAQFNFGWYRLPLFPFLFLAFGHQSQRLLDRPDPLRILLWTGLFLLPSIDLAGTADKGRSSAFIGFISPDWTVGWPQASRILRTTVVLFILPVLLLYRTRSARVLLRALATFLVVAILASMALLSWEWADVHPRRRPGDVVRVSDLRP